MKNRKSTLSRYREFILDLAYVSFGAFICGFALKSFLVPNNFLDGGITGISLLLHELYHWNLNIVIIIANIPFLLLGVRLVNWTFALRSLAAILLLALFLSVIPYPALHYDKLVISAFGGFFLGLGIGIGMRGGCAIDGIEILALYTLKRSGFTITEIILGFNVVIFLTAAFHPQLGFETALYAILTYYVVGKTIDYVVDGLEAYTGITIISSESEAIKEKIVLELGRGITVYKGQRGFMKDSFELNYNCDIIFTVITRLEVRKMRNIILDIDPKAFIFTGEVKEVAGGIIKRRTEH